MKVLVVRPGEFPMVDDIEQGLESLQKIVGGYIEAIYPFDDPVAIVCDEEAKIKGKEPNRALRDEDGGIYDIIAGTFLVVGLGDEDFTSLADEFISKYTDEFFSPEYFTQQDGSIKIQRWVF